MRWTTSSTRAPARPSTTSSAATPRGGAKKAILHIEREYGLTERESHILRYLANERNPTYIANALGISPSTAKAHKYSIFKKLGVHTSDELRTMLEQYETHPEKTQEAE